MSTITISIIVSAITAKIVATYYFKKVDGYVKEMCEMTNKIMKRHWLFYTDFKEILSQRSKEEKSIAVRPE